MPVTAVPTDIEIIVDVLIVAIAGRFELRKSSKDANLNLTRLLECLMRN